MKKEMHTNAHEAAFGGGSASDTPKAALRAPMAPPPYLTGGGSRNRSGFEYRTRNLRKIHHLFNRFKRPSD